MLVAAVDERRIRGLNLGPNATAVGVRLDLPGIVENILRLLPRSANIDVVIENSPLERFWLTELRQDFQSLTNRVRFTGSTNFRSKKCGSSSPPCHRTRLFSTMRLSCCLSDRKTIAIGAFGLPDSLRMSWQPSPYLRSLSWWLPKHAFVRRVLPGGAMPELSS